MNRLYGKASLLLVSAIFFFPIGFPAGSSAQDSHTARLIEGAKKEASLIWYTSTSIEDIKRLFDGFNKKYPFVKTVLSLHAADPTPVVHRAFPLYSHNGSRLPRIISESPTHSARLCQLSPTG